MPIKKIIATGKKFICLLLVFSFLLQAVGPAYAYRSGNYGEKNSFEMAALGTLSGLSTSASWTGVACSAASSLVQLYMYYNDYHEYNKELIGIDIGGEHLSITKSQLFSMIASVVVGAVCSYQSSAQSAADAASKSAVDRAIDAVVNAMQAIAKFLVNVVIELAISIIKSLMEQYLYEKLKKSFKGEFAGGLAVVGSRVASVLVGNILTSISNRLNPWSNQNESRKKQYNDDVKKVEEDEKLSPEQKKRLLEKLEREYKNEYENRLTLVDKSLTPEEKKQRLEEIEKKKEEFNKELFGEPGHEKIPGKPEGLKEEIEEIKGRLNDKGNELTKEDREVSEEQLAFKMSRFYTVFSQLNQLSVLSERIEKGELILTKTADAGGLFSAVLHDLGKIYGIRRAGNRIEADRLLGKSLEAQSTTAPATSGTAGKAEDKESPEPPKSKESVPASPNTIKETSGLLKKPEKKKADENRKGRPGGELETSIFNVLNSIPVAKALVRSKLIPKEEEKNVGSQDGFPLTYEGYKAAIGRLEKKIGKDKVEQGTGGMLNKRQYDQVVMAAKALGGKSASAPATSPAEPGGKKTSTPPNPLDSGLNLKIPEPLEPETTFTPAKAPSASRSLIPADRKYLEPAPLDIPADNILLPEGPNALSDNIKVIDGSFTPADELNPLKETLNPGAKEPKPASAGTAASPSKVEEFSIRLKVDYYSVSLDGREVKSESRQVVEQALAEWQRNNPADMRMGPFIFEHQSDNFEVTIDGRKYTVPEEIIHRKNEIEATGGKEAGRKFLREYVNPSSTSVPTTPAPSSATSSAPGVTLEKRLESAPAVTVPGGVDMRMEVNSGSFTNDTSGRLDELIKEFQKAREENQDALAVPVK